MTSSRFPSFDGRSSSRGSIFKYAEPDGADYDQLVAELVKHQTFLASNVHSFSMTAAQGASNITEVTITGLDVNGDAIAAVHQFDLWLSDAVTGEGHTAVTASGTVTNKTASGLVVNTQVAKKALTVQSLATGIFVLQITDTAKTAFKVCAKAGGKTVVGLTLATGNYG